MTTQEIVEALRSCSEGSGGCFHCLLYTAPQSSCYDMYGKAADLIETLTAELVTTRHQLEQVEQECEAWKRRAVAAERDLGHMIPCYTCNVRPVGEARECNGCNAMPLNGWKRSHYAWRGPCKENGGAENAAD